MRDIEAAFASADPEVRRRATIAVAGAEAATHAPLLMGALGDADWRVRKEAVNVAAQVAEAWGLLPELVEVLCQGENVGLRNAALEVLERLGPRAASTLLVALPRVSDSARKFLVAALGFAGGAGVDRLAELAVDNDANIAQAALEALARIGGGRAEAALRASLGSEDPVQRLAAIDGLEHLGAGVSLVELRPLLEDRLVRRHALRMLGHCSEGEVVGTLLEALEDGSPATALEVAVALGRLLERGGPVARDLNDRTSALSPSQRRALLDVATGRREPARRSATWLLLLAREAAVLGVAAELVAEDRLTPPALDAIRGWGGDAVGPLLDACAALDVRPRATALEMAAELASEGADAGTIRALRASLRGSLGSRDAIIAASAASAMARWAEACDAEGLVSLAQRAGAETAGVVGKSLEALAAREPEAVGAALEGVALEGVALAGLLPAVAALGGPRATDRLRSALSADDPGARKAAVLALPRLGGERAAELAGFALADEDADVQVAAVNVLARLSREASGRPGLEQLRLALRADLDPVLAAAARALGAIGDEESLPRLRELALSGSPGVAVSAMAALRMMDDASFDDLPDSALGQPDVELVKEALRAIARRSESPRQAARLALALEHPAWDVRCLAAALLAAVGGRDAKSVLQKRAEREVDGLVRSAIDDALAKLAEEAD